VRKIPSFKVLAVPVAGTKICGPASVKPQATYRKILSCHS